jgi:site-specific DNA-methyltransferase (adenine-specific)
MVDRHNFNPDVLSCLANLSNDEVFTPPKLANEILDLLPQSIWSNKDAKFLDPCSKTGVFLREIAKRLLAGLEKEIPDLHERINHIFTNQLYGIAITELTAHLTRRSVYCSKHAVGKYSVCDVFDDDSGNIRLDRTEHTWKDGKCTFCGANQQNYDRGEDLETHAYQFIHTEKPEEIFKMKFDVIVGNPPYQMETGGGSAQAKPIYPQFIEQAKKLNPRYLTMIIPSRWYAGGMGLNDFRKMMLEDKNISVIVDYSNAKECFPQNSISGGVCYFLRTNEKAEKCFFTNIRNGKSISLKRNLEEFPVLVRYNEAVEIIRKIIEKKEKTLSESASSLDLFGISSKIRGKLQKSSNDDLILYTSEGVSYLSPKIVKKGNEFVGKYKVMLSKTGAEHACEPGNDGKYKVLTTSMRVLNPGEICSFSYFIVGMFDDIKLAKNLLMYLKTNFLRFLILQAVSSINLSKSVFTFVPMQDFSEPWTDEKLYTKYGLTQEEIAFIESMIRPMEVDR